MNCQDENPPEKRDIRTTKYQEFQKNHHTVSLSGKEPISQVAPKFITHSGYPIFRLVYPPTPQTSQKVLSRRFCLVYLILLKLILKICFKYKCLKFFTGFGTHVRMAADHLVSGYLLYHAS